VRASACQLRCNRGKHGYLKHYNQCSHRPKCLLRAHTPVSAALWRHGQCGACTRMSDERVLSICVAAAWHHDRMLACSHAQWAPGRVQHGASVAAEWRSRANECMHVTVRCHSPSLIALMLDTVLRHPAHR
jgi:hypothetical protein